MVIGGIAMGLFSHFPYTNFHELNLDWLLENLRKLEQKVEDLEKRIDGLKAEILNEVDQKLAEFKEQLLQEVQEKLDLLKQELLTLIDTKISDVLAPIITRIEKIENDLATLRSDFEECCAEVRQEIDNIKNQITAIDARLDAIDVDINNINAEIEKIKTTISTIESRLDNDEQAIDSILASIGGINTSIGNIQNTISTIQTNLNTLGDRISTVESTVNGFATDISDLQTKVANNTNNISTLQTTVASNTSKIANHETRITALENAGSGGGGGEAIYMGTASTQNELTAIRSAIKQHKYSGIYIELTADNLMRNGYNNIDDYVSDRDLIDITSFYISGIYNSSGLTNILDFRNAKKIQGYFNYMKLRPHASNRFNGAIFGFCEIVTSSSDDNIIFDNCIFYNCTINIATGSIAYGVGIYFTNCVFEDTKVTASTKKDINRMINCTITGNKDRYSTNSYGSIITGMQIDSSTVEYTVLDNTAGLGLVVTKDITVRNNTTIHAIAILCTPTKDSNSTIYITSYKNYN